MRIIYSLLLVLFLGACQSGTSVDSENTATETSQTEATSSSVTVEKMILLDGKLEMNFPAGFTLMTNEQMVEKYHEENLPTHVYTNDDNSVNFVLNYTLSPSTRENLDEYRDAFERRLDHDGVTVYDNSIYTINGNDFLVLEFQTPASGKMIYNYMLLGNLEGSLLMANFNCWEERKTDWIDLGRDMMHSITFIPQN